MNGFKWTLLTLTSCFFPRVPLPPSIFAASFRRSFEIRMEKSVVVAKIKCGRDVVDLKIYPADFQFLDFNRWLQNRFPICADAKLIFRDNHGDECFPTKNFFLLNNELTVEVVSEEKPPSSNSNSFDKSKLINQHIPFAVAAISCLVYLFFFQHTELVTTLATLEAHLHMAGYFLKKEVILEAMINGLGWSLMHLFIRRMLNPENHGKWFDGYFMDSCYGGLAACGQTLFKGYFLMMVLKKSGAL